MEYLVSFLEGVITFVSPCLLPMIPIYVTYFAAGEEVRTSIVLRKHEPNCVFCGSSKKVSEFKGKNVCEICRKELAENQ